MTSEEVNIQSYRDLKVWQKAMDVVVECYKLTEKLPPSENFGLISGIRRAAILVPSYIADGKGRNNTAEYLQKLSAASGSLKVVETQLLVVDRLKYLPMSEIEPSLGLCDEVGRMLTKLTQSLRGGRG
jgi:four helix bundle protein